MLGSTVGLDAATLRREEHVLFERLGRDPSGTTRDVLVQRFMPLARQMARRYRSVEELDDLEQIAAIGLMKAIDRFDSERGLAFSSYAFPTIIGELKRHLRDRGWSVRVPRDMKELALRVNRVSGDLGRELGRPPTVAEIAERTQTSIERVLDALQAAAARYAVSLDQRGSGPDDLGEREIPVTEAGFGAVEDVATLEELMRVLPERQRKVLDMRFREDRLQWQIAETLGVTQMQVSRLIREAVRDLQTAAGTERLSA